jgi:cyanophycinase-like exopeptidase
MVLGIDEDTAIEVHANAFTVIGSGTVSVYDGRHSPATPVVLRASTRYNLQKRTQVRP